MRGRRRRRPTRGPDPAAGRRALRQALLCGWLLTALGAVPLGYAAWSSWRQWRFLARAVHTDGIVTSVEVDTDDDNRPFYSPAFSFVDRAEKRWDIPAPYWKQYPPCRVGDRIPVVYDPDDPRQARIASARAMWGWKAVLALVGAVVTATGFRFVLDRWKALRRHQVM